MSVKVCYVAMLCEPGSKEYEVTMSCELAMDDESGCWLDKRLKECGSDLSGRFTVTYVNIAKGEPLPDASMFDYIVVGGTFHDVMQGGIGRDWQKPLNDWLLEQRKLNKPLLGICGGHQAMAVALGGKVTRRPNGTAAGSLPVQVSLRLKGI